MKITTGSNLKIQQGNYIFQYLAAFSALLTIIASGMHYGWPSSALMQLLDKKSLLHLSNDEGSWMAVMPLIGAVLGSLIVASTVDILGRKRIILITNLPFFAAWIMIAYGNTPLVLYIARFIAGVADGWAFTAIPMYVGEIADPKIRGLLGSSVSVAWIFGILLINTIGSYLSITVTALISSIVPILGLLTFIWMPESPYYLLMKCETEKASNNLRTLKGIQDVDSDIARLSLGIKQQMENSGKFFDLFTVPSNRKALAITTILRTAQQLSGTTAITFYTQTIFKEAGDDISSEIATIIYFSVQFICIIFCSSIVDRAGRRPLLIVSITGSAFALFVEGTYFYLKSNSNFEINSAFSSIPVVALIGFVVLFSLGMQSIPILMLGELFPANVKAFALCLADIYFCIIATIISKFFQVMKDAFGIHVPFYAFTISCLFGLVCIILFVPETKGKSLEEIQLYLKGESLSKEDENKENDDPLTENI